MKVHDSLAPDVEVNPANWYEVTTKNAYTTESFNVANTGTQGVQVSVSESMPKISIMDDWASSFFLPPDSSMTFRAEADTSDKVQILGNISVQPSGLSTINISVNVTITNDPPTVSVDSPPNGTTVSGTITITLSGSDPDNDPLTFSITLVDLSDPTNRSSFSGSSYAWNTQHSPEGWYRILGNVTDGHYLVSDSVKVEVVHNRPPTATTPSASNIAGSHSFRVSSTISDPDGDTVTATLYHRQGSGTWSTRGMSGTAPGTYTATISSSDYSVGTTVQFYVVAEDSQGASYQTSTSSHAIPNTAPSVGTPLIAPSSSSHSFTVSASVSDPEGDTISAVLRHRLYGSSTWSVKPMTVGGGTASSSISTSDGYAPGVLIEVQVVANDPYSSSSSGVNSGTLTNNAPEISDVQEIAGTGHSLEVRAQVTDPEEDALDSVKLYYRESGGSFSTKDMALSGGLYRATISPSDGISVSATLEYKVVASDEYGAEAESSLYSSQLGNVAPSIGQPTITDSTNQHTFTIEFPVSDGDGDSIQSATLHHRIFGTTTWTTTIMSVQSGVASTTIGIQHGYLPIYTVEFYADVEDEYEAVSTSTTYTHAVPNHPPLFTEINIMQATDRHLSAINASISDPDGDSIAQVFLEHRIQGAQTWTTKIMILVGSEASTTLDVEDGYTPSDTIEYRLTAGDQYGAAGTSDIETLILPNQDPSATKPASLPKTGHKLDATSTLSDIEGDQMSAILQHKRVGSDVWKEVNMTVQGSTARYTLSTANGYIPKQRVQFRVLVRDIYSGESFSEVTETSIPNRLPSIGTVTIEDEEGTHNFFVEVTGSDPDYDQLFPMCYFRKANETLWNTFYVAYRVNIQGELGAEYEVKFKLSDSYEEVFSDILLHTAPNSCPNLSIVEPADGSILTSVQVISLSSVDPEGDRISYKIWVNGVEVSSASSFTWMTFMDPDGWYNITAAASDGHLSSEASIMVQVDNTPVEITTVETSRIYLKVGDELIVTANMTDFTGIQSASVTLMDHVYMLRDDGQSWDGQAGDGRFDTIFNIPDVPEGKHRLVINATDHGGNFVEAYAEIYVDRTDPEILSISTSRNFTSEFHPYFNVTVRATDNFGVSNVSFGSLTLNKTGEDTWFGSLNTSFVEGVYNYEVEVYDLAGRRTSQEYGPLTVDNTEPSLSGASAVPTLAKAGDLIQVTIGCTDELSGVSVVIFNLVSNSSNETTHLVMELFDDGEHGDGALRDGTYGNSFVLNESLADGNYTCQIESVDMSGNVAQDRTARITVDNTPPSMHIEFPTADNPICEGFGIKIISTDNNGIDKIVVLLNGTVVHNSNTAEYIWVPELDKIVGRSNITIISYDILGHNTSLTIPIWVVDGRRVVTGSEAAGDLRIFLDSEDASFPVEFVQATIYEDLTEENNFTAKIEVGKLTGKWAYTEITVETNKTILFLAHANGEKLHEDRWWEEDRQGKRVLCVTDLSPTGDSYTIQFEPPPKEGLAWSLILKIALAVMLVGLSYAVVRGNVPALPAIKLPRRKVPERPLVPRPLEIPPAAEAPPPIRAQPALRLQLPSQEVPPPKPIQPPTRPPAKPPTRPPTRPPIPTAKPAIRPPTRLPTKPPTPPTKPIKPFIKSPAKPPTRPPTMLPTKPPIPTAKPPAKPILRPTRPPAKPPTRPPTTLPTKPIRRPAEPPVKPPTPPTKPPERTIVSVPRPSIKRMPQKPYVPEKPQEVKKPSGVPPTSSLSERFRRIFRKKRRGGI